MLDEQVSKSLLAIKESVSGERDPAKLRQLLVEINALLDLIERAVAKLEGRGRRPN